jgi:hypothetical protein
MPGPGDWSRPPAGPRGTVAAPLINVSAVVHLRGHASREVRLFLKENSVFRAGSDLPRDVFADERDFLPVRDPEWGLILVRRKALILIEVPEERDADRAAELAEEQGHRGEEVAVYLEDGTLLQGRTDPLSPDRFPRVQDLLNARDSFLRLRGAGRVQLVNKGYIVWVRPLTEQFGGRDPLDDV